MEDADIFAPFLPLPFDMDLLLHLLSTIVAVQSNKLCVDVLRLVRFRTCDGILSGSCLAYFALVLPDCGRSTQFHMQPRLLVSHTCRFSDSYFLMLLHLILIDGLGPV